MNETLRQFSEPSTSTILHQAGNWKSNSFSNPNYFTDGNVSNLDRKGYVSLDNAVYKDNLSHGEFSELLHILLNCRVLLTGGSLNNEQVRHKRILLGMLTAINWGIKDHFNQARLIRAMQCRIDESNVLRKE